MQTRSFEQAGLPRASAETLAEKITLLIVQNKMKMDDTFVKHVALEKVPCIALSRPMQCAHSAMHA